MVSSGFGYLHACACGDNYWLFCHKRRGNDFSLGFLVVISYTRFWSWFLALSSYERVPVVIILVLFAHRHHGNNLSLSFFVSVCLW